MSEFHGMDVFTKKKRREIMQAVRRERTLPEQKFAELLDAAGFKYTCNAGDFAGQARLRLSDGKSCCFRPWLFLAWPCRLSEGRVGAKVEQALIGAIRSHEIGGGTDVLRGNCVHLDTPYSPLGVRSRSCAATIPIAPENRLLVHEGEQCQLNP